VEKRYYIDAVERAFRILEVFSQETPSLTLTEIASKSGISKATVFRFIYTLEKLAYLERDLDGKHYRPGIRILQLGFSALKSLELSEFAAPHLKKLFEKCRENTNLAVLDGKSIIYVLRYISKQTVNLNIHPGSRLPAHCTAMGKAMLLDLSREEIEGLLGQGPYERMTPKTITNLSDLIADVANARQNGYAITDEELVIGRRSVAAPIVNAEGASMAAVSISVPAHLYSLEDLENKFAPEVVRTASQISLGSGSVKKKEKNC
jgi:IclR family transcriptional regulator, pca regulon regulatory protein